MQRTANTDLKSVFDDKINNAALSRNAVKSPDLQPSAQSAAQDQEWSATEHLALNPERNMSVTGPLFHHTAIFVYVCMCVCSLTRLC